MRQRMWDFGYMCQRECHVAAPGKLTRMEERNNDAHSCTQPSCVCVFVGVCELVYEYVWMCKSANTV